jgi:hypothetical protein
MGVQPTLLVGIHDFSEVHEHISEHLLSISKWHTPLVSALAQPLVALYREMIPNKYGVRPAKMGKTAMEQDSTQGVFGQPLFQNPSPPPPLLTIRIQTEWANQNSRRKVPTRAESQPRGRLCHAFPLLLSCAILCFY